MTNRESAIAFVERFALGDVDRLAPLLADQFHLKGPLFEFDSKKAYLDSLAGDLEHGHCEIRSVTDIGDQVIVMYEYLKHDSTITIAQTFTFRDGLIEGTLLAF